MSVSFGNDLRTRLLGENPLLLPPVIEIPLLLSEYRESKENQDNPAEEVHNKREENLEEDLKQELECYIESLKKYNQNNNLLFDLETMDCSTILPSIQKERLLESSFCLRFKSLYHFDYAFGVCCHACFYPCFTCDFKKCGEPSPYSVLFVLDHEEKKTLCEEDAQALDQIGRNLAKLKRLDLTNSRLFWDYHRNQNCLNDNLYQYFFMRKDQGPFKTDFFSRHFSMAAFQVLILRNCSLFILDSVSRMNLIRTLLKIPSLKLLDLSNNRFFKLMFQDGYRTEIGEMLADSNIEDFRINEASWELYASSYNYLLIWTAFLKRMNQKNNNGMNYKDITFFHEPAPPQHELFPLSREILQMNVQKKIKDEIDRIHPSFERCATPLIFQYLGLIKDKSNAQDERLAEESGLAIQIG